MLKYNVNVSLTYDVVFTVRAKDEDSADEKIGEFLDIHSDSLFHLDINTEMKMGGIQIDTNDIVSDYSIEGVEEE